MCAGATFYCTIDIDAGLKRHSKSPSLRIFRQLFNESELAMKYRMKGGEKKCKVIAEQSILMGDHFERITDGLQIH